MNAIAWLTIGAGLALAGCAASGDGDEAPRETPPSAARMVGRVASLHLGEGFVLIETSGRRTLEQGLLLSTVGDAGETSTLVVSGERMGRYAAADFKTGDVALGHAVYARPIGESADPAPGESTGETPDAGTAGPLPSPESAAGDPEAREDAENPPENSAEAPSNR
jgi:hypothetical protein